MNCLENGQNLLDQVLDLVDQGFYTPDAVQHLITALTDFAQTGTKEAWTKVSFF